MGGLADGLAEQEVWATVAGVRGGMARMTTVRISTRVRRHFVAGVAGRSEEAPEKLRIRRMRLGCMW